MARSARVLLAAGGALLAFVATAAGFARSLVIQRFARLEELDARQNVERALSALSEELSDLSDLTEDYAAWDATYRFMQSRDPGYLRSTLPSAASASVRVDVVALMDASGRVVFGRSLDLEHRTDGPIPASFREHLGSRLLRERRDGTPGAQGILVLAEAPMLVASRPILTSDKQGPARGTFVLGRYLDEWEVEKLIRYTRFALSFSRFDDPDPAADMRWARSVLPERPQILTRPRDQDTIAGYALIEDLHERPALVLRVDAFRRIYKEGLAAASDLTVLLVLAGLACSVPVLALLGSRFLLPRP